MIIEDLIYAKTSFICTNSLIVGGVFLFLMNY